MNEDNKNQNAAPKDDTAALFVTARKKQLAEQEAQRKAAEEEAKRVAAEAEVRRLEAEVAARKQKAQEESRILAEEAEERRRNAEAGVFPEEPPARPGVFKQMDSAPAASEPEPARAKPAAKPNKKMVPIIIILGAAGVAVLGIIIALIVMIANVGEPSDDFKYLQTALTISTDDYKEMSKSDRKAVTQALNDLLESDQLGSDLVNFEENDSGIREVTDSMASSWFYYTCGSMVEVDTNLYLYGNPDAYADLNQAVMVSDAQFMSLPFPDKVEAVYMILEYLGIYSEPPGLIEETIYVMEQASANQSDEEIYGRILIYLAERAGLNTDDVWNAYVEYRDNPPAPEPAPMELGALPDRTSITQSGGSDVITLTDNYMGMQMTVPADALVGSASTDTDMEMCTITNGSGSMMVLDMTGIIENYPDQEAMTTNFLETYGAELFTSLTGGTLERLDYDNAVRYDPQEHFFRIKYPAIGTYENYYLFGSYNHKYEHQWLIISCQKQGNDEDREYFNKIIRSISLIELN